MTGGNGHALIATPQSLAAERRSQPRQIADLRAQVLDVLGRHSALVQQAAADSAAIHALLTEHEAALVHHKEALDTLRAECADDSERLWAVFREHEVAYQAGRVRASSFMARLRWLLTGR